jgi:hypothetical protein
VEEIMIKLKKLITESNVWDRKFGEPLPTLFSVIEKTNTENCDCGGHDACGCKITESITDVSKAKKQLQKIMNREGKLREMMYKLSDRLNSDPVNQNLSTKLKNSYTKNVTNFMRDTVKIIKDMK